jgi:hypothetical protein
VTTYVCQQSTAVAAAVYSCTYSSSSVSVAAATDCTCDYNHQLLILLLSIYTTAATAAVEHN